MDIELDELRQWLGDNCGQCKRVGDRLWMNVRCAIASRIVWGGPPYNEHDAALIRAQLDAGSCVDFVPDLARIGARR